MRAADGLSQGTEAGGGLDGRTMDDLAEDGAKEQEVRTGGQRGKNAVLDFCRVVHRDGEEGTAEAGGCEAVARGGKNFSRE